MNLTQRRQLQDLERAMYDLEQVQLDVRHHFAHGTYTRELHIPAGVVLTGKIHRHSCINILAKGKVCVLADGEPVTIEAPHTFVSGAGVKKAGVVLEDAVWINVHPWDGQADLDQIEQEVIVPSFEALDRERQEVLCRG